ncbi:MAG TPA: hypothetical protein VK607_05330, partial [Kofleriaceae bacterium]|nr:hypothetical protein [Kofleriaceae bacterium]
MSLSAASIVDVAAAGDAASPAPEAVARFVGPGYVIAFVAVTAAGVAQAATTPGALALPGGLRAVVLGAALYAVLGTLALHAAERAGSRVRIHAVIAALAALGG